MSSHREAPEISKDPVADSSDLYAFVSPDAPETVTIIANYVPLQEPAAGPNFYEFGDDVSYKINISNKGAAEPDVIYTFRFRTEVQNPDTFLYNTGPIDRLGAAAFNRRQFMTITRTMGRTPAVTIARDLPLPPCNVGPRSTPNYAALAASAVHDLGGGRKVFAGQRADGFYVDTGSIFDLAALRPFQDLHLIPTPATAGVNAFANLNVHTIALQVPMTDLTRYGIRPRSATDARASIGVWTSAFRQRASMFDKETGTSRTSGAWLQVSRLGNPLVNEVLIPMGRKDEWNASAPFRDAEYLRFVQRPEVSRLLPVLYPGVFPQLATTAERDRADLVAILMTGIPAGIVAGFQNYTGAVVSDMLRLNVAIPPAAEPNRFGILGGDLAGFPNGRRIADDVTSIELRALAGATLPLVDASYVPDGAASLVEQGLMPVSQLPVFPYLDTPHSGYATPAA